MSDLFNHSQRTRLLVVLQEYEENLLQAKHWLSGHQENGALYHRELDMSGEDKTVALEKIESALAIIQQLAQRLELPRQERDAAKMIAAQMNSAWVSLSDSHAHNLKGYGEVNPQLADIIDPEIDQLVQSALELGRIFEKKDA
jgi:hypothetical protein